MIFAFTEFTIYCEINTWVEVFSAMGTYTCDKCCEGEGLAVGEIREGLKEK